jgi:hypothetical protein
MCFMTADANVNTLHERRQTAASQAKVELEEPSGRFQLLVHHFSLQDMPRPAVTFPLMVEAGRSPPATRADFGALHSWSCWRTAAAVLTRLLRGAGVWRDQPQLIYRKGGRAA